MGTTPNLGLRYPGPNDPPDGAGAIQNLALDVDAHLGGVWSNWVPGFQNVNFNFATRQWRPRQDRTLVRLQGTVTGSGSGTFLLSCPTSTAGTLVNGTAVIQHGSTRYRLRPEFYSPGLIQFFYGDPEAPVTAAYPAAWAPGDSFLALYEYDVN